MNFDKFAASFENPSVEDAVSEQNGQEDLEDVVLVGVVESITGNVCTILINGIQYEIASSDVVDIDENLQRVDAEEAAEDAGEKPAVKAKSNSKAKADAAKPGPRLASITLKGSSILSQRNYVPAAMVASMGIWMEVVASEEAA